MVGSPLVGTLWALERGGARLHSSVGGWTLQLQTHAAYYR